VFRRLDAVARYATSLPAAASRYGVIGFCWGGGISFGYATAQAGLSAAVVFYGVSPATASLSRVRARILGLYGGSDNRVDATIPAAEAELKRLGKSYEKEIYDGAGHAFMRLQDGQNGANLRAAQAAWPRAMAFLSQALGGGMSLAPGGRLPSAAAGSGSWLPVASAGAEDVCPCGEDDGTSLALQP
jgi:carboxymethylenebutenolidase